MFWTVSLSIIRTLVLYTQQLVYRSAVKSLARPTSQCILFGGENISFDASLVIHIKSTNIPPIMIINRIHENQNLLSLYLVSFLVGLMTYQYPCTTYRLCWLFASGILIPLASSQHDLYRQCLPLTFCVNLHNPQNPHNPRLGARFPYKCSW